MVLYTVMPPEVIFATGSDGETLLDVYLGTHRGVPVWVQARRVAGTLEIVRLITTDPDLYLQQALAPGTCLLSGFSEARPGG